MNTWESMKIGFNRFGVLSAYVMCVFCPLAVVLMLFVAAWAAWDGDWREAGKFVCFAFLYGWMKFSALSVVRRERSKK